MPSLPNLYFECSWWLPEAQPCCLPRGIARTRNLTNEMQSLCPQKWFWLIISPIGTPNHTLM